MATHCALDSKIGFLEIFYGPMYCGKTSSLLRRLNIFAEMGLKILYVNHSFDDRSEEDFSTHNPIITTLGKITFSKKVGTLREVLEESREYDVIGIDEAQFFPDLKDSVMEMVEKDGKKVIVAGLSGDYMRRPFGQIYDLFPLADKRNELEPFCALCVQNHRLFRPAIFTKRMVNSDDQVIIGGKETYLPSCRECYMN